MNPREWTLWWVNGRRMWKKELAMKEMGWNLMETWHGRCGEEKRWYLFPFHLSLTLSDLLTALSWGDFHGLFFFGGNPLRIVSSNLHIDLSETAVYDRAGWTSHKSGAPFTQLLLLSCVEATRSKAKPWMMRPLWCTKVDGLPSCPQTKLPSVSLYSASSPPLILSWHHLLSLLYFNIPVSPLAFPLTLVLLNHLLTFKTNKSTNQLTNRASKQATNQLT